MPGQFRTIEAVGLPTMGAGFGQVFIRDGSGLDG